MKRLFSMALVLAFIFTSCSAETARIGTETEESLSDMVYGKTFITTYSEIETVCLLEFRGDELYAVSVPYSYYYDSSAEINRAGPFSYEVNEEESTIRIYSGGESIESRIEITHESRDGYDVWALYSCPGIIFTDAEKETFLGLEFENYDDDVICRISEAYDHMAKNTDDAEELFNELLYMQHE